LATLEIMKCKRINCCTLCHTIQPGKWTEPTKYIVSSINHLRIIWYRDTGIGLASCSRKSPSYSALTIFLYEPRNLSNSL
jgi:translation initiation factor RLI1